MKHNKKHYGGSVYSIQYTSVMLIHREPCLVEIALDASAPPLTLTAWSKPASLLLNASESFRSVPPHRECTVCARVWIVVFQGGVYERKTSNIEGIRQCVCSGRNG